MSSVLDRDHYRNNPLDWLEELERRLEDLERRAATGLFEAGTENMQLPGTLELPELPTEGVKVVDAGSAGATAQDWIEVETGGNTGYIRVYATK